MKTVVDVLQKKIEEDILIATEFLGNGRAKDFSEYKEITGMLRGLTSCLDHINDLLRNNLDGDND
tara:strand:- start:636 stop:830 length:195 start_codon:yes stop_codon:yes gene_type:complete